jgi:ubiquinone/menaquinone biosynthesis C-methylase UbiE
MQFVRTLMTGKAWDANAKEWSNRVRAGMDLSRKHVLLPEISDILIKLKAKSVLDAGCGSGDLMKVIQGLFNARIVGVDFSIQMCREAISIPGVSKRIVCGNISRLPFDRCSFDAIVANMVLGCVEDLHAVYSEFFRVLKADGVLIFSILHPARVMPVHMLKASAEAGASIVATEDYFNERKVSARLKLGGNSWLPSSVEYYHRTLTNYSAALLSNHFVTIELREPKPAQEAIGDFPGMESFWQLAPFLVWIARREHTARLPSAHLSWATGRTPETGFA